MSKLKLSNKQEVDLKTILYYHTSDVEPTEDDIKAYFAWSDKGDFATEDPEYICKWLSKVMDKPAIYTWWKVFNNPDALDRQDHEILEPMKKLARVPHG